MLRRFGGYDPVANQRAADPVRGHPLFWVVVGQRLYLFYSEKTRAAFLADPGRIIDSAERKWPGVARAHRALMHRVRCQAVIAATFAGSPHAMNAGTRKFSSDAAIGQRRPLRARDFATGRGDQRMPCRDVPFAGGGEPRIYIRGALRDLAKFYDGAARRDARPCPKRGKQRVGGTDRRCERLTKATAPCVGQRRVWIARASSAPVGQ